MKAAKTLFNAWLVHRGGAGQLENEKGVEHVVRFLKTQRARFQTLGTEVDYIAHNRVGFYSPSTNLYCVFPESWEEVCGSSNTAAIATELDVRGYIIKERSGRSLQKRMTFPGLPKSRYYVLQFPDGIVEAVMTMGFTEVLRRYVEGWVDGEDNIEDNDYEPHCCPD